MMFFYYYFLLLIHTHENVLVLRKTRINYTRNSSEKGLQFRIVNCTGVLYNKTLIDLIFG